MARLQENMRIPSSLIPHCPVCGAPITTNLRVDDAFVEDDGWKRAAERYRAFIETHKREKILFLELGVGGNTPGIIKYPFWRMVHENPKARYVCINSEAFAPSEITARSICISSDIASVLKELKDSL